MKTIVVDYNDYRKMLESEKEPDPPESLVDLMRREEKITDEEREEIIEDIEEFVEEHERAFRILSGDE